MKLRISYLANGIIIFFSTFAFAGQAYPPSTDHAPPAWFVDVAAKAGITVRNVNGSVESKRYIIEATGSGVAILDYDRDGWPDIFLVNGTDLPSKSISNKIAQDGVREPVLETMTTTDSTTFTLLATAKIVSFIIKATGLSKR